MRWLLPAVALSLLTVVLSGCAEDTAIGLDEAAAIAGAQSASSTTTAKATNSSSTTTTSKAPAANATSNSTGNSTSSTSTTSSQNQTSGQNSTGNATAGNGTADAAAGPAPFAPIHHEYTTAYFCELCTDLDPTFCIGFTAGVEGIDCGWTELPPEAIGHAYAVAASGLVSAAPHVAFFAACSADAAMLSTEQPTSGSIPEGAGCLVAWDFDGTSPNIAFVVDVL